MRARHRSTPQLAIAFVMVLLVAACSPAAAPETTTASDPPASEEVTPEVTPEATPDPTPEAEPSEAVGACMDSDTYELLVSSDHFAWTDADREQLAAAIEAYDFSDLEPALRARAEGWAETFASALRRGAPPASLGAFLPSVQTGEIPIVRCE